MSEIDVDWLYHLRRAIQIEYVPAATFQGSAQSGRILCLVRYGVAFSMF